MQTITQHVSKLRESSSECIDNGAPVQVPEAMAPGDMLPQGDIGLLVIAEDPSDVPSNWTPIEWPAAGDMQLAPGNTKGSRHTIPRKYARHVRLFRINDGDQLSDLGIANLAPFDMEHPEHADHLGYPSRVYRVRHQQNAQRERVID